ncbi:MAG: steroid-22-oyl-CoA synthetase, partial [Nocardioidaceae bacterium]|nr:steroid-22-oyl-CoA synthetase [Nocardioidaceae bacterium]
MSEMTRPTTDAELVLGRASDDRTGLVFEEQRWTWREVVEHAVVRAAWLTGERRPGPFHVGVLLENTPEYLFLLAGAALAGATVVGINPTRRGAELAGDVRHTDCQLVVTDADRVDELRAIDLGLADDRVLDADADEYIAGLQAHRGATLPAALPTADDLFVLIFTSGS